MESFHLIFIYEVMRLNYYFHKKAQQMKENKIFQIMNVNFILISILMFMVILEKNNAALFQTIHGYKKNKKIYKNEAV